MRRITQKSRRSTSIMEKLENRQLFSHTLQVGPTATYHTIQSAVNAASPGDTIIVAPGTYTEQVTIPGKDNGLSILAKGSSSNTFIQAPAVMTGNKAVVDDNEADNVHISGFTIEGPGSGPNGSINYGVVFDNGYNCELDHCTITHIHDTPTSGNPSVFAVASIAGGGVYIHNNTVNDYQTAGIVVSGIHSSANIAHNIVTGNGPITVIAQNGIEFINGGFGTVQSNVVSKNIDSANPGAADGILLYNSGQVYVLNNLSYNNDSDIFIDGPSRDSTSKHAGDLLSFNDGSVIQGNTVSGATFDGIDVYDGANSLTISNNTSYNNGFDGIFFSQNTGTLPYGNIVTNNTFYGNATSGSGFDIEDTTYLQNNPVKGTAKTANYYDDNTFTTSNDPKLQAAQQ